MAKFPLQVVYLGDELEVHRQMWASLSSLTSALHAFPGEQNYLSPEDFRACAVRYAKLWSQIALIGGNPVSPYLHILCAHTWTMLREFGSIAPFSLQSLEYNNHEHRRTYHRVRASQKRERVCVCEGERERKGGRETIEVYRALMIVRLFEFIMVSS